MKKETNFNDLINEEKMGFNILQSTVKDIDLSYGYRNEKICISKVDNEWLTYTVDRGQIFDLKKFSCIYDAVREVLKKVSENEQSYDELINTFHSKINEAGIDFKKLISEKDVLWLETIRRKYETKNDIPEGIKRMAKANNKRKIKIFKRR